MQVGNGPVVRVRSKPSIAFEMRRNVGRYGTPARLHGKRIQSYGYSKVGKEGRYLIVHHNCQGRYTSSAHEC